MTNILNDACRSLFLSLFLSFLIAFFNSLDIALGVAAA